MNPEERMKRAEQIRAAYENDEYDSIFNNQLKEIYDAEISIVDRISASKGAVFYAIANAHCQSDLEFKNIFHMYTAAMVFGFHLGHDYVAKYGPIPDEAISEDVIEKMLDFEEEE